MGDRVHGSTTEAKNLFAVVSHSGLLKKKSIKLAIVGAVVIPVGLVVSSVVAQAGSNDNDPKNDALTQSSKKQSVQVLSTTNSNGSSTSSSGASGTSNTSSSVNSSVSANSSSSSQGGSVQGTNNVTVNGRQINVPANGSVQETTNSNGQTTTINASNSSVGSSTNGNVSSTNFNVTDSSTSEEGSP